ncbi:MAG: hypothetical protein R3F30_03375 [Planctomycetota bacterium]
MKRLLSGVLLLPVLAAPGLAQSVPSPYTTKPAALDSGPVGNNGGGAILAWSQVLRDPTARSLQLHFGPGTRLAQGSMLVLTSLLDGHVQLFEPWSLSAWELRSAFFNGDAVRVDLVVAAGTWNNRVQVTSFLAEDQQVFGPLSQCGPTDDRVPSQDPRNARQQPTGCTTWLIAAYAGLTAGHCTSSASQVMEFNVPLSTTSGSLVHPGPSDQYPYVTGTLQRLASGIGADWSTFVVARNSNTGLYPGEKQGSWYELGKVPTSTTGNSIRITGYGTYSLDRRYNQVQQTHVGPLYQVASTYLRYTTDTTGGNSGSPVIHEQTGQAVGIHTHSGCTTSSTNPTGNHGTRIDRSDLQTAIAQTLAARTVGTSTPFGSGCKGSAGTPVLEWRTLPTTGRSWVLGFEGAPAAQPMLLVWGASDTTWGPLNLPLSLAGFGASGCSLLVSVDVVGPASSGSGSGTLTIPIPASSALVGVTFHNQLVVADKGANQAGLTTSNGLTSKVGKD